jgi:hypothetical protein
MYDLEESLLARLTTPDVLTPAQYYEGVRTQHSETLATRRLMLAVLEDALRCLQTHAASRNPVHRKAFGEAEIWILDRKARGLFAFETICETLAICPDHLRDGIRRWLMQLSNGLNSRRLQRRSVGRCGPIGSLVLQKSRLSRGNLVTQSTAASEA